jgi:hypothetical protein
MVPRALIAGTIAIDAYDRTMHLAVQAPIKLLAVGGATLALAVAAMLPAHHAHRTSHRLSLSAPELPEAIYISAWAHGDLTITRDDSNLTPLEITSRARIPDGCTWLGIEILKPIDARHYSYSYDETILSCEPDAIPYIKTPRVGLVTVED